MDRKRHAHMTCGFCLQPKIVRSKPHETKSGQPICPDCLEDWNACFPKPVDPLQKSFEFLLT